MGRRDNMARRRMIDPNFWQSEDVASLTIRQRLLLIGLFSNADDEGKLRGNPAFVRSTIFPYDDIPVREVQDDLDAIEGIGTILQYQVGGNKYIKLVNWKKFQRVDKPQKSMIPDPPQGAPGEEGGGDSPGNDSENDSGAGRESAPADPRPKEEKGKENKIDGDLPDEPEDDPMGKALREIENHYIQRRGLGLIPSAKDMADMESLLRDGFTVKEIIEGIDFAFDNYKPKHSRDGIKTFGYCETVIRSLRAKKEGAAKGRNGAQKRGQKDDGWDNLPKAVRRQMEMEARGEIHEMGEDPVAKAKIMEELNRMRRRFEEKRAGGQ